MGEFEQDGKVLDKSEIDRPSWALKLLRKMDVIENKLNPLAEARASVENIQASVT